MTKDERRLISLETYCAGQVASVHGWIRRETADELERLRNKVGRSWDAVNGHWAIEPHEEGRS